MKRTLYIVSALAAVMLMSCNREPVSQSVQEDMMVFTASWGEEPATKTMLDPTDSTKVLWSPDEYFRVYSGTMSGIFYSMNAVPVRQIEIRGGLAPLNGASSGSVTGTYWAIYPSSAASAYNGDQSVVVSVSSQQQGADSTFANQTAPAVAKATNYHFTFYNVCGGIRFTVEEPGIEAVKISSIGGDPLTGRVTVEMGANGLPSLTLPATGNNSYVTLTAPEGGFRPGVPYYAMVLPGTHSKGFAFTFIKPGTSVMTCVDKSLTVQRSRMGVLDHIDAGLWNSSQPQEPELVDLGFGDVLWATFNLGATRPEEFGNFYAWGETEPKAEYTWDTYKWGTSDSELTKYITNERYGTIDNKRELDSEDDAASAAFGEGWRTPSEENWNQLKNNCIVSRETVNGIPGLRFTSNMSGYKDKSIFIPITGYWNPYMAGPAMMEDGWYSAYIGDEAYYLTNRLGWSENQYCVTYHFYSPSSSEKLNSDGYHYRYQGYPVRPVKVRTNYMH